MNIRKASLSDLSSLVLLFDAYRVFYEMESDLEQAQVFLSERFKNQDSEIFVAESNDGLLLGFVQLYPIFSSTRMKRLWLLNDLFVKPESRGKGISKLLLNAGKKLSTETNACGLILETAKSNAIGNALYPAAGFTLDQEHNYYFWS